MLVHFDIYGQEYWQESFCFLVNVLSLFFAQFFADLWLLMIDSLGSEPL